MLLLSSTSDIVQVITGVATTTIGVHASWADLNAGVVTAGRTNTAITGAATTTVVASPASSTTRNVKLLVVSNSSASTACPITVQHYDGTTTVALINTTLLGGERLTLGETGQWVHYDTTGAPYAYNGPVKPNLGITGTLAETIQRELCTETNTTVAASGTLNMQGIYLYAGTLVSSISLCSATTAASAPTHYQFGLYDSSLNLLASSADQTSAAWAAQTLMTLPMQTPYRVPTSGFYYIGYFMTAGTVPTLKGFTARSASQLAAATPVVQGTSSTSITALPNPAASVTAATASFWAAVQ